MLYNYGVTPVQKVFQLPKHVNHALGEIYISFNFAIVKHRYKVIKKHFRCIMKMGLIFFLFGSTP